MAYISGNVRRSLIDDWEIDIANRGLEIENREIEIENRGLAIGIEDSTFDVFGAP